MKLAEKNSAGFQRQNSKRAEKMQAINGLKTEIAELEQTLKAKQHELEAIKVEKESRAIDSVIEPAEEGDQETNEQTNEQVTPTFTGIDPVAKSNIEAANISAAIKKKAIAYLSANPTSHKIEGISAKSLSAIMENIKTALFAEIKALSQLFKEDSSESWGILSLQFNGGHNLNIGVMQNAAYETGYGVKFTITKSDSNTVLGGSVINLFDSTTTLEDLRSWGFALPFDLDVKAFVANVIKPVVDEFLSKMQTGETETETPTPEPTPLDTESEAEPIAPIEPVQNETAEIDAEIESLKQLIGMPEFSDALDALLDKLEAAGLDSQYETVVSDIIIQDAQAESAKVGV